MLYNNSPKSFLPKLKFFNIVTKKFAKIVFLRELSLNDFFFFLQVCKFFKFWDSWIEILDFSILKILQKKKKKKNEL